MLGLSTTADQLWKKKMFIAGLKELTHFLNDFILRSSWSDLTFLL